MSFDDLDPEDILAHLRASVDQAAEQMPEFARLMWSYYEALCEQGFSEQQAMEIALGWQYMALGG